MKKVLLSLMAILVAVMMPLNVLAKETKETKEAETETTKEKINVYLFWGNGCGYCEAAKEFFASIEDEYGKYYNLVDYEVWYNEENNALKESVAEYFNEDVSGVPYIIIGETTFGGYASDYDDDIKKAIKEAYEDEDYVDAVAKVQAGDVKSSSKNYDTLIVIGIFAVVIGGFGALIYFSRK